MAEVMQRLNKILRQVNPFDESCNPTHQMKRNILISK
jgi:hypothetical protein